MSICLKRPMTRHNTFIERTKPPNPVSADLFCQVIDNLGDIGVMWRLARQLTKEKNWHIRLWIDRPESLHQIEPRFDPSLTAQTCEHIDVRQWCTPWNPVAPHPVVIAGFSCELPEDYLQRLAMITNPIWLQLEYLSAEDWVSSFHGLHSKRNDALKPVFFFPGFRDDTGGLIREQPLLKARDAWRATQQSLPWLASLKVTPPEHAKLVSVFTYPHAPLHAFITQLEQTGEVFHLLVPSGKQLPSGSSGERVTWQAIDFLAQLDYDKLLWSCDLNLVRGEDSFVRAIWAGKPMLWQIYPQKDGTHHVKLDAWLKLAKPPTAVGDAMHQWADGTLTTDLTDLLADSKANTGWQSWQRASDSFCATLAQQTDLATRLDSWVRTEIATPNGL